MPAASLSLLLVDDDPLLRTALADRLVVEAKRFDRQVDIHQAASLEQALTHLASIGVQAVLLDLQLPDSAGIETVTRLVELHPSLAVVVISGGGGDDEGRALEALGHGAQDFLLKGELDHVVVLRAVLRAIERKRLESDLWQIQQLALRHEQLAAIGTIAGGIAHEVNGLNAVVLGNAEVAQRNLSDPGIAARCLQRIVDAAQRTKDVTKGLHSFVAMTERGSRRFELQGVVTSIIEIVDHALEQDSVELNVRMPPEPVHVEGNGAQLGQALLNLVITARQALIDAFDKRLEVLVEPCGSTEVMLAVIHSGVAMDAEQVARIFRPFAVQADEETARRGRRGLSGALALSLVNTIAQRHGGRLEVEATAGVGNAFRIYLPCRLDSEYVPQELPAGQVDLSGCRVLVVDDDLSQQTLVRDAIEAAGGVAQTADNGLEALERMDHSLFDCVVLDWHMPVMNGAAFLKSINRPNPAKKPYVVLLSGWLPPHQENALLQESVNAILVKPARLNRLMAVLAQVIRNPAHRSLSATSRQQQPPRPPERVKRRTSQQIRGGRRPS